MNLTFTLLVRLPISGFSFVCVCPGVSDNEADVAFTSGVRGASPNTRTNTLLSQGRHAC